MLLGKRLYRLIMEKWKANQNCSFGILRSDFRSAFQNFKFLFQESVSFSEERFLLFQNSVLLLVPEVRFCFNLGGHCVPP